MKKSLEKFRKFEVKGANIIGGGNDGLEEPMNKFDNCYRMCKSIDNWDVKTRCMDFCKDNN